MTSNLLNDCRRCRLASLYPFCKRTREKGDFDPDLFMCVIVAPKTKLYKMRLIR